MHFVFALPCFAQKTCPKNRGLAVVGVFLAPGGTSPGFDFVKNIRSWMKGTKDMTFDFKKDILDQVRSLSWENLGNCHFGIMRLYVWCSTRDLLHMVVWCSC